jgi:hypothetical protein
MSWWKYIYGDERETPDGSPQADWDEYRYTPQEDITAYELSLIITHTSGWMALPLTTYVQKDPARRHDSWPKIERHYTKKEEA